MRIAVDGIPAAGLELSFGLHDSWASEAASLALDGEPAVLEGRAHVHRASKRGVVRVDLVTSCRSERPCDRCGDGAALMVRADESMIYSPRELGDQGLVGEIELDADQLDLGWYEQGALELADVLREALTLACPARVVCTDVRGCDRRTKALLAASGADDEPGHPGFAVLKGLT